ncbi:MAG: hypothetical protein ABFS37_05785 [Acidobacteriota bacterium]
MKMKRTTVLCILVFAMVTLLVGSPGSAFEAKWTKIGDKNVKADKNEAVMRVGVEDGRFRMIKIGAEGGRIDFKKVTVEFIGGEDQVFDNFTTVRDGGETRPMTIATAVKKPISLIKVRYEIKDDADQVKITVYGRGDN